MVVATDHGFYCSQLSLKIFSFYFWEMVAILNFSNWAIASNTLNYQWAKFLAFIAR
jgi:hypothetical protein